MLILRPFQLVILIRNLVKNYFTTGTCKIWLVQPGPVTLHSRENVRHSAVIEKDCLTRGHDS